MRDRHIKGQRRRVEHRRFNEGFMQYASTSPFYPLFASLDVGAQMMKGRSGEVLWDDTIRLGIELRKKLRAVRREFEEKENDPARRWFFDPFVPDRVVDPRRRAARAPLTTCPGKAVSTDHLARDPRYWALAPGEAWHGFAAARDRLRDHRPRQAHAADARLRPQDGRLRGHGIPAPVVAQYLRENRVVAEKNDLNSLLFLLTPGVESSKAGTLVSALVAFKRLHDDNALLDDVMPEFVATPQALSRQAPARPLRAKCTHSSATPMSARLQKAQFARSICPNMVMTPREASRHLVRNNVDYLPLDALEGRIATTLFVVYPPGIATIVPGERLDARARPMIDYLKMFEKSSNVFPGFEAEIQGLYRETDESGDIRFYTYVVRE